MQKIMGYMRKAITEYNMISNDDRIAVGVSGGKDSVALLIGLCRLRDFIGLNFKLYAITIDPCFNGKEADYSELTKLFAKFGVEHIIHRTNLAEIIFIHRKESNPCSLCSNMRRGMLHNISKELNCNKIALGHNYNDAVETFVMNLFHQGRIDCFQPVTYLSRTDLTMIRPLIFAPEKDIKSSVKRNKFPIVKSKCPVDGITTRETTKNWLLTMEKTLYPGLTKRLFGAMRRAKISGW